MLIVDLVLPTKSKKLKPVMRNYFTHLTLATILLCCLHAKAQSSDWTAPQTIPQVFIENQGQYDEFFPGDTTVKFGIDHGFGWRVSFTNNKTAYLIQAVVPVSETEEKPENFIEERREKEIISTLIVQEWLNTDDQSQLLSADELYDYYTYSYLKNEEYINVDHARAFDHLHRDNLYPGIDLEYTAPNEGGVKYTLKLAPNADLSQVSFKYTGAPITLDDEGNLRMPAVRGALIDHAPKAWYADNVDEEIPCSFVLNGDVVSFSIGNYDHNRAIVVDPWTVNPALPAPFNRSYEVDNDNAGNVFVFGGGMGFNVKKYNSAGTLQWTHVSPWDTSNAWFGEMLVLGAGDLFITSGSAAKLRRLTAAGATTFTNNGPFFNVDEYWTLSLNCNTTKLLAGGTRIVGLTSPQGVVFDINMTNGNQLAGSPFNVRPVGMKEVRAFNIGGDGNFYALANDNLIAINQTFGVIYSVAHTNALSYNSPSYKAVNVQGVNAIDANLTHIYINYGSTLEKRLNGTGAIVASVPITGGGFTGGFFGTGPTNSGMVVDDCGNVYVGSSNAVYKYDANLNLLGSVATTGAVYDLKIAAAGTLIIGGNAFLTSNTTLAPCAPHSITCTPPLPVEITNFEGYADGKINRLNWTTSSEINNDHFILEKSSDAMSYETHAIIDGAGNSNIILEYESIDARPYPLTYYRLKQVDFDGDVKYFGPITVENNNLEGLQVQSIYPNPANENFMINLFSEVETAVEIQVYDALGKLVFNLPLTVHGSMQQAVNSSTWSPGVYIIKVVDKKAAEQSVHRIIVE